MVFPVGTWIPSRPMIVPEAWALTGAIAYWLATKATFWQAAAAEKDARSAVPDAMLVQPITVLSEPAAPPKVLRMLTLQYVEVGVPAFLVPK